MKIRVKVGMPMFLTTICASGVGLAVYVGLDKAFRFFAPDITSSFKASEAAYNSWFPALAVSDEGARFIVGNTGAVAISAIVVIGLVYLLSPLFEKYFGSKG